MGLPDNGTFQLDCNFYPDDAGQIEMRTAREDRQIRTFRATFSDATTLTFQGYVLSAPVTGGVDSKVDTSFSIRISGAAVFA
jgi:hypothetical protein